MLTFGLYASILSGAMIQGGLGALLPYMGQDMPMTHTLESLHITGLAVGGLVASAVAEVARRRMGRGWVLIVGAAACALGALLLAVAQLPLLSAAAMLFVGFGLTSSLIAGQVLLVALHGRRHGSRMIGELNVSYSVGAVVAAVLLPIMAASIFGWRGFAGVPAVILVLVVLPLVFVGVRRTDTEGVIAVPPGTGHASGRARFAPAVMLLSVVVEWGFLFWLATHLTTVAGLTTEAAARAAAAMWVAVLVGRIVGSRLLGVIRPGALLAGSLVLAMVATFVLDATATPTGALVAGVIAGLAAANLYSGSVAYVIEADPLRADGAVARGSLLSAVALIVAPLGMGVMADAIGLRAAYLIVALTAVTAAFLVLVVIRPRAKSGARAGAPPIDPEKSIAPATPTAHVVAIPTEENRE